VAVAGFEALAEPDAEAGDAEGDGVGTSVAVAAGRGGAGLGVEVGWVGEPGRLSQAIPLWSASRRCGSPGPAARKKDCASCQVAKSEQFLSPGMLVLA